MDHLPPLDNLVFMYFTIVHLFDKQKTIWYNLKTKFVKCLYGSVSLIQSHDSRRPGFGKPIRMCPGGECAECVDKKWLTSIFELSGHAFGTILKSDALTFQSASI